MRGVREGLTRWTWGLAVMLVQESMLCNSVDTIALLAGGKVEVVKEGLEGS